MTGADNVNSTRAVTRRILHTVRSLRPPIRIGRFWLVQAGVLLIVFLDVVVLDVLHFRPPFGMPTSTATLLLLIPVIYAARNFGFRGAVNTALWATALMACGWIFLEGMAMANVWLEFYNLIVVIALAIVVGQRVDREKQARQLVEQALHASELAETRYRGLFEEQASPVLVTDSTGVVAEANSAALQLLGADVRGHPLSALVEASAEAILAGEVLRLDVQAPNGDERLFVPRARTLEVGSGERLVEVVLIDVTEEQRRAQEQRAYAGHLLAVQEDERRRLAQDMHDDPLQTLTYLVRTLDQLAHDQFAHGPLLAAEIRRSSELAAEVANSLREVIRGLRPPVLDDLGLGAALRHLVAEVHGRSGLPIVLRVNGDEVRLASSSELTVYRVTQEALNNVVRHAQAKHIRVDLRFGDPIQLTVTDDGQGMLETSGTREGPGGLGLVGMRERVGMVGGSLETREHRPHGTLVRATLPRTVPEQGKVP